MYKNIIEKININQTNKNLPKLETGYFVEINFYVEKNKIQKFSGLIISKKNNMSLTNITIRKISNNEGIEKTFFIHSPNIKNIIIYKKIKFRKSKLYFIRYNKKNYL